MAEGHVPPSTRRRPRLRLDLAPRPRPTTTDLAERPDEVRGWADRFDRDNRAGTGRAVFDLDRKIRRTRTIGDTSVPIRAHIPSLERLCTALGTQAELATLDQVLATTRSWSCGDPTRDAIASWVADNPRTAIEHHEIWHDLLAVVAWIADDHRDRAHLDLRHLDVPGVDTKFVERHRKVLGRLLAQVLPEELPRLPTRAERDGRVRRGLRRDRP